MRILGWLAPPKHGALESTLQQRSRERYRRVAITGVATGFSKVVALAVSFAGIPIAVRYLGTERFGLWVTISSFTALLSVIDLGIGSGLVNALAKSEGEQQTSAARQYVSSSFVTLTAIAILLAAVFALVQDALPWATIFNLTSSQAINEVDSAVAVFAGCWLIALPFAIAQKTEFGLQEGYVAAFWSTAGSVLGLIGLIVAVQVEARLPWLVLALAGAPALSMILNFIYLFGIHKPQLRPSLRHATQATTLHLLSSGGLFLIIQIAGVLGYESDNLVLTRILGPEAAAQYSVPLKLFLAPPLLLGFFLTPLWPAYGEAFARGDAEWARRTFHRSLWIGLTTTTVSAVLLLIFGRWIILRWAGPSIQPTDLLLWGLASWCVLHGIGGPIAMLLTGARKLTFQAVVSVGMGLGNLGLSIWLATVIGIPGVVFGSVFAQILLILIPSWFYARKVLDGLITERRDPESPAPELIATTGL